jgi:hypothetical protein
MVLSFWIAGFQEQVTFPEVTARFMQPGILFPSTENVIRPD